MAPTPAQVGADSTKPVSATVTVPEAVPDLTLSAARAIFQAVVVTAAAATADSAAAAVIRAAAAAAVIRAAMAVMLAPAAAAAHPITSAPTP